ncbi:MAG: SPOR domain-containing protein [Bacteroidales bacterium]|nr:SPOR domain-containing protein [Bacteroidales bacterium]
MKVKATFIITTLLLTVASTLSAKEGSIIDKLQQPQNGAVVIVNQPIEFNMLLQRDTTAIEDRLTSGYRIQVFSDNMQKRAKDQAYERARIIQESDPELATYVTFNSPFWRVRVGNFISYEEAAVKLRELKKQFPEILDMRIVKDIIIEKY